MSGTSLLKEYVALVREKQKHKDGEKEAGEQIQKLMPDVLKYFEREGIDKITIDGMTLYPKRELYSKWQPGINSKNAADKLEALGFSEFVSKSANAIRLRSYVRELDANGEAIPDELQDIITISELFKVGHRNQS